MIELGFKAIILSKSVIYIELDLNFIELDGKKTSIKMNQMSFLSNQMVKRPIFIKLDGKKM